MNGELRASAPLTLRGVIIAVLAPTLGTAAAIPLSRNGAGSAVSIYMLSIVASAVAGGFWSGVISGALASLAFAFFIEPPTTPPADETVDVVTAVLFLAVALIVGLLVGSAIEERQRAARREREAQLLSYLTTKLLSGEVPDRVLDDFATVLLEPLGLASCEIAAVLDGTEIRAGAVRAGAERGGPSEMVSLVVGNVPFGTLTAERSPGRRPLAKDERALLETAAKQAAAALDRARLDARARMAQLDAETNQLRAAMFSSVTHDLRTPLASIKAGVTSLLDDSVTHRPEQQRELLTTIREETDRLNRLVGNILDLAKIRAGALTPSCERASLDEILEAVLARMRGQLGGVRVLAGVSENLPDVWVDPMQIDQVLTNLLENAARHSTSGQELAMSVSVAREGVVRVAVADHGPGIAPEERERVFEPFYRGAVEPERPGTGLGLAIVKAIVVAHGGRIWIEDTAGGGTTVVVELPMREGLGS